MTYAYLRVSTDTQDTENQRTALVIRLFTVNYSTKYQLLLTKMQYYTYENGQDRYNYRPFR